MSTLKNLPRVSAGSIRHEDGIAFFIGLINESTAIGRPRHVRHMLAQEKTRDTAYQRRQPRPSFLSSPSIPDFGSISRKTHGPDRVPKVRLLTAMGQVRKTPCAYLADEQVERAVAIRKKRDEPAIR